ncbi:unnamed protein product [Boreogadus saida]
MRNSNWRDGENRKLLTIMGDMRISNLRLTFTRSELTRPELPPKRSGEEEKHGVERDVLPELSYRTAAELPQPELLVRWSCHLASAPVQLPEYTARAAGLRPDGFDGGQQLRRGELGV